jgi:hypothetical protein
MKKLLAILILLAGIMACDNDDELKITPGEQAQIVFSYSSIEFLRLREVLNPTGEPNTFKRGTVVDTLRWNMDDTTTVIFIPDTAGKTLRLYYVP